MTFDDVVDKILSAVEVTRNAVLATASKDGVVSVRQMKIINDGLKIYMQTDKKSNKVKEIKENPNVAFNFGIYSFKGKAKISGHPNGNKVFVEKLKQKALQTYKNYTNLPDEVLVEIEITECRIWGLENKDYTDGKEIIHIVDFKNKNVSQIFCDKIIGGEK